MGSVPNSLKVNLNRKTPEIGWGVKQIKHDGNKENINLNRNK